MGNLTSEVHACSCSANTPQCLRQGPGRCLHDEGMDNVMVAAQADSQLLQAACDGDKVNLLIALHSGAGVDSRRKPDVQCGHIRLERQSSEGLTPLMFAAKGGHSKCVTTLLQARALVNALDDDNRSALHYAAEGNHYNIAVELIRAGADRLGADSAGHLPHECTPRSGSLLDARRWNMLLREGATGALEVSGDDETINWKNVFDGLVNALPPKEFQINPVAPPVFAMHNADVDNGPMSEREWSLTDKERSNTDSSVGPVLPPVVHDEGEVPTHVL